jgi:phytoene dehydrogenase-like protein
MQRQECAWPYGYACATAASYCVCVVQGLHRGGWLHQYGCWLQVRDKLLTACTAAGVRVRYGAGLADLKADDAAGGWRCALQDGSSFHARRVVSRLITKQQHAEDSRRSVHCPLLLVRAMSATLTALTYVLDVTPHQPVRDHTALLAMST